MLLDCEKQHLRGEVTFNTFPDSNDKVARVKELIEIVKGRYYFFVSPGMHLSKQTA